MDIFDEEDYEMIPFEKDHPADRPESDQRKPLLRRDTEYDDEDYEEAEREYQDKSYRQPSRQLTRKPVYDESEEEEEERYERVRPERVQRPAPRPEPRTSRYEEDDYDDEMIQFERDHPSRSQRPAPRRESRPAQRPVIRTEQRKPRYEDEYDDEMIQFEREHPSRSQRPESRIDPGFSQRPTSGTDRSFSQRPVQRTGQRFSQRPAQKPESRRPRYDEYDDEMAQFERDHPQRTSGNYGGGDDMGKTVKILAAVAAALFVILLIVWISKNSLVKELNYDKQNLTNELVALQSDYETITTENAAINDSLAVEKEKVEQLIERLKKTEATNRAKMRQYEKELGTLRSIMKSYIVQIDSLNTLNTQLRKDASAARREAAESRRQYNDLRSKTDELTKVASAGAVLKARGITLWAINSSSKETDRSSRAVKLRTDLSLIENTIAEKGYRTVYIRIKGPDGILLTDNSNNVFTCAGEQMIYSASREVDYQGAEVDMSIYFASSEGFVKGTYTVDVYTKETKLGSADLQLK